MEKAKARARVKANAAIATEKIREHGRRSSEVNHFATCVLGKQFFNPLHGQVLWLAQMLKFVF